MLLLCLNLLMLTGRIGPVEGHPTSPDDEVNAIPLPLGPFDPHDLVTGPVVPAPDDGPRTRTPPFCNYAWPTVFARLDEVQACHDGLAALDDTPCPVPPPPSGSGGDGNSGPDPPATFGTGVFCRDQSGQSIVMGVTFKAAGTSSACRDVATGVQWILDNCPADNPEIAPSNLVAGQTAAWGNGDLIVVVQQGTYLNWTAPPGLGR
ncbi:hypothetical protein PG997_010575 [Apiospora hydei]|uniref:Uncharacterized protein n=1 Tax=Apiospora hydei TaxID=1337664 RepID=A0ABR1VHL6_9PEZI